MRKLDLATRWLQRRTRRVPDHSRPQAPTHRRRQRSAEGTQNMQTKTRRHQSHQHHPSHFARRGNCPPRPLPSVEPRYVARSTKRCCRTLKGGVLTLILWLRRRGDLRGSATAWLKLRQRRWQAMPIKGRPQRCRVRLCPDTQQPSSILRLHHANTVYGFTTQPLPLEGCDATDAVWLHTSVAKQGSRHDVVHLSAMCICRGARC